MENVEYLIEINRCTYEANLSFSVTFKSVQGTSAINEFLDGKPFDFKSVKLNIGAWSDKKAILENEKC